MTCIKTQGQQQAVAAMMPVPVVQAQPAGWQLQALLPSHAAGLQILPAHSSCGLTMGLVSCRAVPLRMLRTWFASRSYSAWLKTNTRYVPMCSLLLQLLGCYVFCWHSFC